VRQPAGLDADQGDVAARVGTDHHRVELALVGKADLDLVGLLDHVRIGQDVAVRADDEA